MPTDFDFTDENETPAPTEEVVVQSPPPQRRKRTAVPIEEPEDDEIDRRMAKAQVYWSLLSQPFFEDDDIVTLEVEAELVAFVRLKLAELMGAAPRKKSKGVGIVSPRKSRFNSPPVPRRAPNLSNRQTSNTKPPPQGLSFTGNEVRQTIVTADGFTKERVFKRVKDSNLENKEYYLGYDIIGNEQVGDGNKYELATNASGGQYMRVLSHQTLPPNSNGVAAMTKAQLEAQSAAHAQASMASMRESIAKNPLLAQAIQISQKE